MTTIIRSGLNAEGNMHNNKKSCVRRSREARAWKLLAPAILVLISVAGWPLLRTIWFGFTDANINNFDDYNFIWFENYLTFFDGEAYGLLADPTWWKSVWNTLSFAAISVSIETVLGLGIALVLNQKFKGRAIVRAAVLIPWAIPTIVSAQIWSWMLHDQFGIVNDFLLRLNVIDQALAWTADSQLSLLSVIMVDVWKTTPFMVLLILAALQMVPKDIYEAAKVDGVNPVKTFYHITLPLIAPAVAVAVIFRALDALRVFDLIYVLTSNNTDTMSMSVYARQQLVSFQDVGVGSAASTFLFIIIAACTLGYLYFQRKNLES